RRKKQAFIYFSICRVQKKQSEEEATVKNEQQSNDKVGCLKAIVGTPKSSQGTPESKPGPVHQEKSAIGFGGAMGCGKYAVFMDDGDDDSPLGNFGNLAT
ncbi:hypothetical protein Dimus_002699, partial [Dionaea muscipula]